MSTNILILGVCYLILCFVTGSLQLSITEFAVPTAIQAGENAELQCRYDLEPHEPERSLFVKWWWTPLNASFYQKKQLYQRTFGYGPQAVHGNITIKDNDTIVIQDLEPEDSGTYECEVSIIDEVRRHQKLIVYSKGSGPVLHVSTVPDGPDEDEEEDVQVSCEATDVAPEPDLSITVNGEIVSIAILVVPEQNEGLYNISANATISKDQAIDAEIICELFFKNENISHPAYRDTVTYELSGVTLSTPPETPEDTLETEIAPDSLQKPTDGSYSVESSWTFILAVATSMHLLTILGTFL